MREADFGTVDGAIAGSFYESEVVGIVRVEKDLINALLQVLQSLLNLFVAGMERP